MNHFRRLARFASTWLCFVVLVSACSRPPNAPPAPAETGAASPTQTVSATATSRPSTATSLPTLTPIPYPAATATSEVAAVRLVPIASQANALRGLIPEGWIEVGPGTFARMKSPDDQAYVIQTSVPKTNEAWLRYYLMREIPYENDGDYSEENLVERTIRWARECSPRAWRR